MPAEAYIETPNELSTELADALAAPRPVHFAGKDYAVSPLNFNNLVAIEEKFGDLDNMDLSKVSTQRFVLWLILSQSDPELTEHQVGSLLTLQHLKDANGLILTVFRASGLAEDGTVEEAETPGKLEKGAAAKKKAASPA